MKPADITYELFSVRDVKTGFLTPTLDMNGESAIRNFEHACLVADSLFYTHAQDYSLYRVGTFYPESGMIEPAVPPVHIVDASSFFPDRKKGE